MASSSFYAPEEFFETHPLTSGWWMASSQFIIVFFVVYVGFHSFDQFLRENRDQIHQAIFFNVQHLSFVKNCVISSVNAYTALVLSITFMKLDVCIWCVPLPNGHKPYQVGDECIAELMHLYLKVKIIECLDTIVYAIQAPRYDYPSWIFHHHYFSVVVGWAGLKYYPGGQSAVFANVNCICHAIIYCTLAIKYLFQAYYEYDDEDPYWRSWIALLAFVHHILNNVQFALVILLALCSLSSGLNCGYPDPPALFLIGTSLLLVIIWNRKLLGLEDEDDD